MTKNKRKIYCISGLGVDHRAFEKIKIDEFELIPVPWLKPEKKESLSGYARRLFEVTNPEENYLLMGVSFGGMVAQEWAKIQRPSQLILISTTNTSASVKATLRIPGKLGFVNFLSPKIALSFGSITSYFFGLRNKSDKDLLRAILKDTDPIFLRWAAKELLAWKTSLDKSAIWIHGQKDKMISPPDKSDFTTDGGHFTVYTDGALISTYLMGRLK